MKTLKITVLLIAFIMLSPFKIMAQNQMLTIHEDRVKPAMEAEYKKVCKDLVEACKKYDLQNSDWWTIRINDGTYLHVAPIKNMADLDVNTFAPLAEKMGKENFTALFDRFTNCYDQHGDYIVIRRNDLSYQPATASTEMQNFRKYHFFYVTPENSQKVAAKMKEIAALFAKKGAKEYYTTYHSGFGNMSEFYVVVLSAKDEQSYEKLSDENNAMMGEDWKTKFNELYILTDKYEQKSGYMHPELGYIAKK